MRTSIFKKMASVAVMVLLCASIAGADPWKFGVMSDTQWKANLDGENPGTVAVGIINQLNAQFLSYGVKFVIQVGDLVDKETDSINGDPSSRTMQVRAAASQALYDAGIGFFPVRGNHEASAAAALELVTLYPQTQGNGANVVGASNFSSPVFKGNAQPEKLKGLSYSFDYGNARFILIDQFTRLDGTNYLNSSSNNTHDQMPWIASVLESKPEENHVFVFGHKNLMGQNHMDNLFGSNPVQNPLYQDWFIGSLAANGGRYYFSGHDHMHHRSVISGTLGYSSVQEIICASNSYKFYVPAVPSGDERYNLPYPPAGFGFARETPIAQELLSIGFYIVTVDGPRVTVDFYSSANGCDGDCNLVTTPALAFTKRETFGYGLNGKQFLVSQGEAYDKVKDSFRGTSAAILGGTNGSTEKMLDGRALTKSVNIAWTPEKEAESCDRNGRGFFGLKHEDAELASDALTLWGMAITLGNDETDAYALSLSYDRDEFGFRDAGRREIVIAAKAADGSWVNAVDLNYGGDKKFVFGPYAAVYGLGTYGVDPRTHTAWAVINHNGVFAVAKNIEPDKGHGK